MPCVEVFVKDPQVYLRRIGIRLTCPVHPGEGAIIDADFRAYVNHEIYFFSSREARERFEKQPLRFSGIVTDPVREARFQPTRSSPRYDYHGRPYFFSSEDSRKTFGADPERYANPKRVMKVLKKDEPLTGSAAP